MQVGYLGIDQYGQHYTIKKHPRKELLNRLGRTKASNLYCDTKSGGIRHVGYVIADLWIEIFKIHQWKEKDA